jgi:hypothetical protein
MPPAAAMLCTACPAPSLHPAAGKLDPVDHGTLRQAQRISRFAVAAYGLQGVIWAKGQ